jgi:hypothetical protein
VKLFRSHISVFVFFVGLAVFSASTMCNVVIAMTAGSHTEQTDECCSHESEAAHEESGAKDECGPGADCSHCVCSHLTVTEPEVIVITTQSYSRTALVPVSIGTPLSFPASIDHPPLW